jgi:hypothetical protein
MLLLLLWWWWWSWSSSELCPGSSSELCPVILLEDSFVSNVCHISSTTTTTSSMAESFPDSESHHWKCKKPLWVTHTLTDSLTDSAPPHVRIKIGGTPSLLGVLEETFCIIKWLPCRVFVWWMVFKFFAIGIIIISIIIYNNIF